MHIRVLAYPYTLGRDYRLEGVQAARRGLSLLRTEKKAAEKELRAALHDLVNAFLTERQGNRALFTMAHGIGRTVEREFGCWLDYDPKIDAYWHECPVAALHSRMGASAGMVTSSACSICGAAEFQCDHIPGQVYGASLCRRVDPKVVSLRETSLTQDPDFPETFATCAALSRTEFEIEPGVAVPVGTPIRSNHCWTCTGVPTREDIDPGLWKKLPR